MSLLAAVLAGLPSHLSLSSLKPPRFKKSGFRLVVRLSIAALLIVIAAPSERCLAADVFLVTADLGTVLLGPDGQELERLYDGGSSASAFSPDGKWVTFTDRKNPEAAGKHRFEMIIQSRRAPQERTAVPLVWGVSGSSFDPLWSSDSQRILICEQGWNGQTRESSYRIYDVVKKEQTELTLPKEWWPKGWSTDGKRLLLVLNERIKHTGVAAWRQRFRRVDRSGGPLRIGRAGLPA